MSGRWARWVRHVSRQEPDTPMALVERGTRMQQRGLVGTLATMPAVVEREQPEAPTLIIIGEVVRLHEDLAWFGSEDNTG